MNDEREHIKFALPPEIEEFPVAPLSVFEKPLRIPEHPMSIVLLHPPAITLIRPMATFEQIKLPVPPPMVDSTVPAALPAPPPTKARSLDMFPLPPTTTPLPPRTLLLLPAPIKPRFAERVFDTPVTIAATLPPTLLLQPPKTTPPTLVVLLLHPLINAKSPHAQFPVPPKMILQH
jgi:hypothetical protein